MMSLLDIRDELTTARNFVACVYLACNSRTMPSPERSALCEVASAAREKLEAVCQALDEILKGAADEAGKG